MAGDESKAPRAADVTPAPRARRKALSKRVRFAVFARDGFRCRYCGRQSDEVTLVVDHIIPVVEGGTDDEENLTTACEPCNQGKAAKRIDEQPPEDPHAQLARQQELNEQRRAAETVKAAAEAHAALRQEIVNLWCDIRGTTEADRKTISVMVGYARQYGIERVVGWIEYACARLPGYKSDYQVGCYVSGIRRSMAKEGDL